MFILSELHSLISFTVYKYIFNNDGCKQENISIKQTIRCIGYAEG